MHVEFVVIHGARIVCLRIQRTALTRADASESTLSHFRSRPFASGVFVVDTASREVPTSHVSSGYVRRTFTGARGLAWLGVAERGRRQ